MDASARPDAAAADARREVVAEWLDRFDVTDDGWEATLSPVAMTVADALLAADAATLAELGDPLRDALADLFDDRGHAREARGYLLGMLALARWGLQRLPDPAAIEIDRSTHQWKMLVALDRHERLSSGELRDHLQTNESQVSRTGRHLLASGLVAQRRAGRTATWELTPRGRQVLREDGGGNGGHRRARAR
jgi:hypothetical protein